MINLFLFTTFTLGGFIANFTEVLVLLWASVYLCWLDKWKLVYSIKTFYSVENETRLVCLCWFRDRHHLLGHGSCSRRRRRLTRCSDIIAVPGGSRDRASRRKHISFFFLFFFSKKKKSQTNKKSNNKNLALKLFQYNLLEEAVATVWVEKAQIWSVSVIIYFGINFFILFFVCFVAMQMF